MPEELTTPAEPTLLRVTEVAELLRIDRSTAYDMIARGLLPSVRFGRSIRVPRAALFAWLDRVAAASVTR